MTLWLQLKDRPDTAVQIDGAGLVIGRGSDCDWVLDEASVSRRHAVIRHFNAACLLEDVSRNGCRLNGRPLVRGAPVPLAVGDELNIAGLEILVLERRPEGPR